MKIEVGEAYRFVPVRIAEYERFPRNLGVTDYPARRFEPLIVWSALELPDVYVIRFADGKAATIDGKDLVREDEDAPWRDPDPICYGCQGVGRIQWAGIAPHRCPCTYDIEP